MIRLLTPTDSSQYRQLRLKSRQTDPDAFISTFEYEQRLLPTYFSHLISSTTQTPIFGIYGIFDQDHLFAHLQFSPEYLPKQSHLANLFELYVNPSHRRQHLATQLLQHTIGLARHHPPLEQLHLKVISTNHFAQSLYQSHGFHHIATRENTIKSPDGTYSHEHLYCLSLFIP